MNKQIDPNTEKVVDNKLFFVVNALIRSDQKPTDFSINAICEVFNVTESQAFDAVYLADIYKQQQQQRSR